MTKSALALAQLLDAVMNNRAMVEHSCEDPGVYRLPWQSQDVWIDINARSVTLGGDTFTDSNDPTDNRSVISIVGFVQAQLDMR